jgi:hypothetical protein
MVGLTGADPGRLVRIALVGILFARNSRAPRGGLTTQKTEWPESMDASRRGDPAPVSSEIVKPAAIWGGPTRATSYYRQPDRFLWKKAPKFAIQLTLKSAIVVPLLFEEYFDDRYG